MALNGAGGSAELVGYEEQPGLEGTSPKPCEPRVWCPSASMGTLQGDLALARVPPGRSPRGLGPGQAFNARLAAQGHLRVPHLS